MNIANEFYSISVLLKASISTDVSPIGNNKTKDDVSYGL